MRTQNQSNVPDPRSSDGVSLLITILVRFPQIGTIQYNSKRRLLSMNFLLSQSVSPDELTLFQKIVEFHLDAYHHLTNQQPTVVKFETKQPYEKFCMFTIIRDIATLSKGEISLLSTLMTEKFQDRLILDDSEFLPDFLNEMDIPDEMIDSMFEVVRAQRAVKNLTALRENGRVLVFTK